MSNYKFKDKLRWLVPGAKIKRYVLSAVVGLIIVTLSEFAIDNDPQKFIALIVGQILIIIGLVSIIIRLWRASPKGMSGVRRADQLYREAKLDSGPNIVAIGGGTGLSAMLRAAKKLTSNVTAIVTVADNGGNSGVLRKELGVLPPGDIRNCVIALSETEAMMDELLNYRFAEGTLSGYCMGNLFLVAMSDMNGGFLQGIKSASDVLAVTGQVLPVTLDNVHLIAEMDSGERIEGEDLVGTAQREHGGYINKVYLDPIKAKALPQALDAIEKADIITLGPGSLYTSILPNLLVEGVADKIAESHAVKIYVSNLMTQSGETENYDVYSHIKAIEEHLGQKIFDYVLINDNINMTEDLLNRYKLEYAEPVELGNCNISSSNYTVVRENLLENVDNRVRHSVAGLANAMNKVYNKYNKN